MNKRIKELAAQAKLGGATVDENINYFVGTEETFTNFVNLIIEECANTCYTLADLTQPCPTGKEFEHVYIFAGDRIRELKYNTD
jgi:hypothetical protein